MNQLKLKKQGRMGGLLLLAIAVVVGAGCANPRKSKPPKNYSLTDNPLPGLSAEDTKIVVEEILQEDSVLGLEEKFGSAKAPNGKISDRYAKPVGARSPQSVQDVVQQTQNDGRTKRKKTRRHKIPVELNKRVGKWIHYYTIRARERFQTYLERALAYKPFVEKVFREKGMPEELFYLGIVESGYNTKATSHANAGGVWQFIPATGRRYGLEKNYYYDERRDPIRSTLAAAEYLKDLHNLFQSWHLAMSAYNAGERRVMRAILKAKSRNYWEIVRKRALPPETRDYVPKFLAAYIIGRQPEKFGFKNLTVTPRPELVGVNVPSPIRLKNLARIAHMSEAELKKHNPHLSRGVTPPNERNYKVWFPKEGAGRVQAFTPGLNKLRVAGMKVPRGYSSGRGRAAKYHRVRRGENLGRIARRYGMSVRQLKRLNGLRSSRIYAGRRLVVATKKPARVTKKSKGRKAVNAIRTAKGKTLRYRVRRGDSLYSIARKFGTTIAYLKRINNIRRNKILAGQKIRVPTS